jgi:dihydrodipicolinate synthase/N-acetylneuraminate lyase
MSEFQSVYAAAITPRSSQGDINFGAMFDVIDYLCAARTPGIVLFDGAGEYPAYTAAERSRIAYLAVKRSRAPLMVGVGSPALDVSVTLAREARDAGAAGVVVPPPLFFNGDTDDLMEFYREFAANVGQSIPAIITNFPDSAALVEEGLFAGVLDSSDESLVQVLMAGGAAISPVACAVPELVTALACAIGAGDQARVAGLEHALCEFLQWSAQFPSPAAVKTAAAVRGVKTGPLLAPLAPQKQALLDRFRSWFKDWLPAMKSIAAHG